MANTIINGNSSTTFKVGSYDCKIYLGTVKLYPHDSIKNYLRTVAKGNGTISLTIGSAVTTNELSYVAYSTDAINWTTVNNVDNTTVTASTNVSSGDTVYWKGSGIQTAVAAPSRNTNDEQNATIFSSTAAFDIEGNAMSMLYGDNFEGQEFANGSTYNLCGLFYSATTLVNASGMTLPATASTENCYNDLFAECDHLLTVPTLSATTTAPSCFKRMFRRCRALPSVPSDYLPITTLSHECYHTMFSGCWALTAAPNLPATTLARRCYYDMFEYCSGLTVAPTLSATRLVSGCYNYMFRECTSLQYINCQATSFSNADGTYNWVSGVPSGGTFVRNENVSINSWTYGRNGVPRGWTVTPPYYAWRKAHTTDYVCNLETHTKYYKEYYSCTYDLGWTWERVTPEQSRASEDVIDYNSVDCGYVPPTYGYFTIRSMAANNTITLKNNTNGTTVGTTSFAYSLDSGSTWTSFTLTTGSTKTIATLASGDTVMLKGDNSRLGHAYNYGHYFRGSGNYVVEGNIASLINNNDTNAELSSASASTFAQLFSGDTHLISAENLVIASVKLPESCFNSTFRSCTNLVKAPELPSTILGKECYSSMFEGCTSLAYPPSQLYFTSASYDAYARMFCMSRSSKVTTPAMTYTPKLFGNWGSTSPTNQQMFCGNGNLATIYCYWTKNSGSFSLTNWVNYTADSGVMFYKRSTSTFNSGVNGIKSGWTVVNDDTTQPT